MVQFTPGLNISISVATNVESMEQAQPSDAYCLAYNRVRQIMLGEKVRPATHARGRGGAQASHTCKGAYRAPPRPQWGRSIHVRPPVKLHILPLVWGFPLGLSSGKGVVRERRGQ